MRLVSRLALAFLTLLLLVGSAHAANRRLYLLSQYNWGAKTGFYLDFEGTDLAKLPLILGVASGTEWKFASHTPGFQFDREYAVRAVIEPTRAWLELDGVKVGELDLPWKPCAAPVTVDDQPEWARDPGDWLAVMTAAKVTVTRAGQTAATETFDLQRLAGAAAALRFFEPSLPQNRPLDTQPGDTLIAELKFRFLKNDPRPHAPFLDRFGQARHAAYPGKVKDEAELRADIAAEDAELAKLPPSPDFDQYGGYLKSPWKEQPTGFYRVLQRDGKWWLVSPAGNPCFYQGVCSVPGQTWETTPITGREHLYEWLPPHEGEFAGAWAKNQWGIQDGTEYCCFYTVNLIRKYGPDFVARATERATRRLQALGLQGGKWGCGVDLSSTPVLHRWSTPNLVAHPDVFDPAVVEKFKQDLAGQITPHLQNPRIVGWSMGNEYDEHIKRDEVRQLLAMTRVSPGKQALVDYALQELYGGDVAKLAAAWKGQGGTVAALYPLALQPPDADVEKVRCYYQDRYWATAYRLVKELDPNHLYLGSWIVPGWWESEEDWRLSTRHCDVVGYDRYSRQFADERLERLLKEGGKPVLCGEFSLPAWYEGARGFGRYPTWARDEEEAAELYRQWIKDATANPYCVGTIWFIYRDQPLTGRGPGRGDRLVLGEHYAFGFVTETDRIKWPLARAVRETNLQAAAWRLRQ